MSIEPQLPGYADSYLAALSEAELIDLLKRDGDRVPRNVIDECVQRGERVERAIDAFLTDDALWDAQPDDPEGALDAWWFRLHAIMILGLMTSMSAGVLLVHALARTAEDEELQDWFMGSWPALFRNKPADVLSPLEAASQNSELDPYVRINMIETIVSIAERSGGEALDQALASVACLAAQEDEDPELRRLLGCLLLNFPRPQYRDLLDELATMQEQGIAAMFDADDVQRAYDEMHDEPEWLGFTDPWQFYSPDQIAARQQRWSEELQEAMSIEDFDDSDDFSDFEDIEGDPFLESTPFVRDTPKVGRNDPCPCGSGKKYKKCCLLKDAG